MSGCTNKVTSFVPRGYGYKEISLPCGSTSSTGGVNLCSDCLDKLEARYPQGWRYTPGDTCKHGTYVGDAGGPDYLCGLCESE